MIRIVFFDLGMTLIDASHRPFPHAAEALATIQRFTTPAGEPLLTALVSDYEDAVPPTPARIAELFQQYLAVLDGTGLRPLFEPADHRVTLSTHAGVRKPDRRIFATALSRLGTDAPLGSCLLVTEAPAHVRAARTDLGMSALQFRSDASPAFDFDDWLQAPAMIAHAIDPAGGPNAEAAIRLHLAGAHAFDVQELNARGGAERAAVRGTLWKPVGAAAGELADVHAPFWVEGEVTRGPDGRIRAVRLDEPPSAHVAEAVSLVKSLARHGQLQDAGAPPARAATHDIEIDEDGRRKLVRKRLRAY
jgi:FMN phosphatase YigB (HAD superfamily)